jgi:hypothetical protein
VRITSHPTPDLIGDPLPEARLVESIDLRLAVRWCLPLPIHLGKQPEDDSPRRLVFLRVDQELADSRASGSLHPKGRWSSADTSRMQRKGIIVQAILGLWAAVIIAAACYLISDLIWGVPSLFGLPTEKGWLLFFIYVSIPSFLFVALSSSPSHMSHGRKQVPTPLPSRPDLLPAEDLAAAPDTATTVTADGT